MRIRFKAGALITAASAFAIAVPAMAHPSGSNHPSGTDHPHGSSASSGSHRCSTHTVAFIVHGTVDSSQTPITVTNGSVSSGTLLVDVTRTNHWAKADRSATQPVGLQLGPNTTVVFDGSTSAISGGERVTLIGKAPVVKNKHCSGAGTVGTPTIRMVVVHSAAS